MKKSKLTAVDLAIYFGAMCAVEKSSSQWDYEDGRLYLISTGIIYAHSTGRLTAKPVLRHPSSITADEIRENHEAYTDGMKLGLLAHGTAGSTRHWISLHIDLFGWIEAGLAIEKTETL